MIFVYNLLGDYVYYAALDNSSIKQEILMISGRKILLTYFRRYFAISILSRSAMILGLSLAAMPSLTQAQTVQTTLSGEEISDTNTGDANTGDANTGRADVRVSERVRRSLSEHPALQSGRARICQSLYRLGITRAETRPQVSGSIDSQRQLLGHFKASNNTDRDSSEARRIPENELNVYDLKVSLRQKVWDWHVSNNRIRSEQLTYEVERIRLDLTLSEQLLQLLTLSTRIDLYQKIVRLNRMAINDITPHIEAVEAQGEAGIARFVDVRKIRLLLLDAEIALKEAENNHLQAVESLKTRFRLRPDDARLLLEQFFLARPHQLVNKSTQTVNAVHAIELQVRKSVHDVEAIDAELWPVLNLNIDGTMFDVGDFESEYEVTGQMSLTMPLYDGGSNKARLSEASWRLRELGQDKRRQIQDTENEMTEITQQFTDVSILIADLEGKLVSLGERLVSLTVLSESSDIPRISIVEAILESRVSQERLLTNLATLEILRANNLHFTDELSVVMNIPSGERTC